MIYTYTTHYEEIEEIETITGRRPAFRAICSCGWKGSVINRSHENAMINWRFHVAVVLERCRDRESVAGTAARL